MLGDAALELGRPDDAAAAYDRLEATGAGPWLDVRRARLAYVTGDPARAVRLAARARAAAASDDPADAGFYAYAHAEYARLTGDAETARSGYEAALAVRATDLGAIVGLARIDAAAGDTEAAIAGLRRAAAIAPQPETLALLGDLLAASGDRAGGRRAVRDRPVDGEPERARRRRLRPSAHRVRARPRRRDRGDPRGRPRIGHRPTRCGRP